MAFTNLPPSDRELLRRGCDKTITQLPEETLKEMTLLDDYGATESDKSLAFHARNEQRRRQQESQAPDRSEDKDPWR